MSTGFYTNNCIVCGREEKYKKDLRLFRFPSDIERCRAWIKFIGRKELVYMTMEDLREQSVCDAHFPPLCTNGKGNRLHKIALPTIKPAGPPLSDAFLAAWPRKRLPLSDFPVMLNLTGIPEQNDATATTQSTKNIPLIDYELPLMNCIETLLHNKTHLVKKPAGILNTIAVPLMSYSSSLEHGTVFAAADPKDLYLNMTPENMETGDSELEQPTDSNMGNDADIDPYTNDIDHTFTQNTGKIMQNQTKKKFIKLIPTKDLPYQRIKNYSDITLTPNTVTTVKSYKAKPKPVKVGHPYKHATVTSQKVFDAQLNPNTGKIEQRYVSIDSIATNPLDVTLKPKTGDMELQYSTTKKERRNTLVTMFPAEKQSKYITVRPNTRTFDQEYQTTNELTPETNMNSLHDNTTDVSVRLNTKSIKIQRNILIPKVPHVVDDNHDNDVEVMPIMASLETINDVHVGARARITNGGLLNTKNKLQEETVDVSESPNSAPIKIQNNILIPKSAIAWNGDKASNAIDGSVRPKAVSLETCKNVYIGPKGKLPLPKRKAFTYLPETNYIEGSVSPNTGVLQSIEQGGATAANTNQNKVIVASIVTLGYNNFTTKSGRNSTTDSIGTTFTTESGHNTTTDSIDTDTTMEDSVVPDITDDSLIPSSGYINTPEISFVPYSEYEVNVTPESADAHVGGGTLDYGLPLMNCIGTILQGNISSNSEETDDSAIDVPLMKCFKTLEHSGVL